MQQDDIDPQVQETRKQDRKLREGEQITAEANDIIALMLERQGRRIMFGLLARCGVYTSSFAGDPHLTAYNEGRRSVGVAYLDVLNTRCPDEFVLMLKEHREDVSRNASS